MQISKSVLICRTKLTNTLMNNTETLPFAFFYQLHGTCVALCWGLGWLLAALPFLEAPAPYNVLSLHKRCRCRAAHAPGGSNGRASGRLADLLQGRTPDLDYDDGRWTEMSAIMGRTAAVHVGRCEWLFSGRSDSGLRASAAALQERRKVVLL